MARYNHLPIFQQTYKMTLEVYRATHQFPREYKYSLGQTLKETAGELLDMIVIANAKNEKMCVLEECVYKLEQLRIQLRLACDLKILGLKRYEQVNRCLEEINKQLSGWVDWARKRNAS